MSPQGFDHRRYRKLANLAASTVCLLFAVLQHFASSGRSGNARSEWEARLNQQQAIIRQSDLLEDRLLQLRTDELNLLARLEGIRRKTPNGTDNDAFLEQLASTAESSELIIQDLQPGSSARVQSFDCTTIRMTVVGSWAGMCQFLSRLRNTERLCSVDEFHLTVPDRAKDELLGSMSLGIFSAAIPDVARSADGVLQ